MAKDATRFSNDRNYPYWPADFMQNPMAGIAGRQNADGIVWAAVDCRIPPANGMTHDLQVVPYVNVSTAKVDALAVKGFAPISGRGPGAGLFDLMAYSVSTTGQGKAAEKA
jgi:hypothetical protein